MITTAGALYMCYRCSRYTKEGAGHEAMIAGRQA